MINTQHILQGTLTWAVSDAGARAGLAGLGH
jgi:hypothetical protein